MFNPIIMFVRISENCNAGCFMCGYARKNDSYNITEEKFENLLNFMKKEKTYKMVRFTGGEPLLHPLLSKFIKQCKQDGYITSIITNGFMLPDKIDELIAAGLDQIIISLDGSKSEIHDHLRGLVGGLEKIKNGVERAKFLNPNIHIRANTVISPFNIGDLSSIYDLLNELNFDSWSLIPIKGEKNCWRIEELENYKKIYYNFIEKSKMIKKPELLGYSQYWAGTTVEDIEKTFTSQYRIIPRQKCQLVELVRFYIPDKDIIVPCNCVAHRIPEIDEKYYLTNDLEEKAKILGEWLALNYVTNCTGCEPINAYLSDNPLALKDDLLKY